MRYMLLVCCLLFSLNANALNENELEAIKLNEWIYTKTIDPFTDVISSNVSIGGKSGEQLVYMTFYCYSQKSFAYSVDVMGASVKDSAKLPHNFVYRIDKNTAVEQKLKLLPESNGLITLNNMRIIRDINIEGGDAVLVKVRLNESDDVIVKYTLKNAQLYIKKVIDDCNLVTAK